MNLQNMVLLSMMLKTDRSKTLLKNLKSMLAIKLMQECTSSVLQYCVESRYLSYHNRNTCVIIVVGPSSNKNGLQDALFCQLNRNRRLSLKIIPLESQKCKRLFDYLNR